MRSLAGLVFFLVVSTWSARAEEAEWIYTAHFTVNARTEDGLVRARDQRLAEVLRPLVAPRVLWRYAEREPAVEGQLVARLTAVVSTTAPLAGSAQGIELLGQTRPGLALALHAIGFLVDERSGGRPVPTEAARARVLGEGRVRAQEKANKELSALIARAGTAGTAWRRLEVSQEVETDAGWIWVTTRVRVEAVFLGPDVLAPDVPPRPRAGHEVERLVKLVRVGSGVARAEPAAAPSCGLTGALDLTPAKTRRRGGDEPSSGGLIGALSPSSSKRERRKEEKAGGH